MVAIDCVRDAEEVQEVPGGPDIPRLRPTREIELVADEARHTFLSDAIARDKRTTQLLYLSVIGDGTALKSLRAVLCQPRVDFKLRTTSYESDRLWESRSYFGPRDYFKRDAAGYKTHSHNLGCKTWQLVVVSRRDGFMPCLSAEGVWQELSSPRYTTPVLEAWCPWLMEQMRETWHQRRIEMAEAWGCSPAVMNLTDEQLDSLVVSGIKSGKLRI